MFKVTSEARRHLTTELIYEDGSHKTKPKAMMSLYGLQVYQEVRSGEWHMFSRRGSDELLLSRRDAPG